MGKHKILVVAPHMDDEVLGCAGTIMRHVKMRDEVTVCIVANRAYNHLYHENKIERQKNSTLLAKKILGYQEIILFNFNDEQLDDKEINIITPLEKVLHKIGPHYVYVSHGGDNNQDHRAVFNATMVACRSFANKKLTKLLSYEIPSSTEQAPPLKESAFLPNYYVNIERFIYKKIKALRYFKDECKKFPHPRSPEALIALARKRGSEAGFRAAEAFMILREKW